MHAMATPAVDQERHRIPMSWDEYEALGPEVRGEYVDGCLVMSPLPSGPHQDICARLWRLLDDAAPAGVGVRMSWGWKPGADEFGPDVMVFDDTDEDKRLHGTPHLAVEVLSTDRAADLVRKFGKYAAAGLARYWIIDPEGPELMVFELEGHGYAERTLVGPDDRVELSFGPGSISVRPRDLLRRDGTQVD